MISDFQQMTEALDWINEPYEYEEYEYEETDTKNLIKLHGIIFTFSESGGLIKVEKESK